MVGPSPPPSLRGTDPLGLTIKDGVATVDLSTEFDSGGGTASMQYRLAQVVYTLTQFPTVKSVLFQVEGKTVTVFGSEGIALDGPPGSRRLRRSAPIDLRGPTGVPLIAWQPRAVSAATPTSSRRRSGSPSWTGPGKTVADQQVMATCGTGCRGTFDVTIRYTVSKAQWGTLPAYNLSAKDGAPRTSATTPCG